MGVRFPPPLLACRKLPSFRKMEDIVTRLRAEIAWEADVGELMADAADEIERLREAIRRLAEQDATPPAWLQRPYYVDPPEGWRYGFPKVYDPAKDGDMTEWMISQGYPKKLAMQGLPCTFTACE
jgi:hypothetical protein